MKTKDINNLIEELDNRVGYWRDNRELFSGGCCFAAHLLAKGFESKGVKYSVVVYQNGRNWYTNKFNRVFTGYGCGHVAICVVYKHKKMIIGADDEYEKDLIKYLNYEGAWKVREYKKVNSIDLINIYKNNSWNWRWNKRNNKRLSLQINDIFNKYE